MRRAVRAGNLGRLVRLWAPILAVLVVAPFLVMGITWGLPSRDSDRYLFASHPVWSGEEILRLAGGWSQDERRGADVARNRLGPSTQPIALNDTDEERARIILRYRLYTHQPDEMINLRAYSQMRPGRLELDPKMYQYGGVWFYPNAVALKLASVCGLVTLSSNAAHYIEHPDQAGRIYVVLRCMTVMYALSGVVAMYLLARMAGGSKALSCLIGIAFGTAPGIVVFAHEAKPHIAGLTLTLFSLVAGVAYVKGGGRRWLWASGVLAGLAFGAVLTALPAALIPITAAILRRERRTARAAIALVLFAATYAVTNPYVVHHAIFDRRLLVGQLSNTTAMYGTFSVTSPTQFENFESSLRILLDVMPLMAFAGLFVGAVQTVRSVMERRSAAGAGLLWSRVFLPTATLALAAFFFMANGKPGEAARFGLIVIPLALLGPLSLVESVHRRERNAARVLIGAFVVLNVWSTVGELGHFLRADSRIGRDFSREGTADQIAKDSPTELVLVAEPAPYNTPPIDLWRTRLLMDPAFVRRSTLPGAKASLVQPPFMDWDRMSWADRRFAYCPVDKSSP